MAEVIGVRFKNMGKVYYFDPNGGKLAAGDRVDVTGISKGHATRRHQALWRTPPEGDPRLRPRRPSGGLPGATSHMSKIIKAPSAPAIWAWSR